MSYMNNEQLNNLITMAVDRLGFMDTMIVEVKYKYSYETEWTIDNEILECCNGQYTWKRDWWEGQEDVEYTGIIPVSSVIPWRYIESVNTLVSSETPDRLVSANDVKSVINEVLESCNDDDFREAFKMFPKFALLGILMNMTNYIDSLPSHDKD